MKTSLLVSVSSAAMLALVFGACSSSSSNAPTTSSSGAGGSTHASSGSSTAGNAAPTGGTGGSGAGGDTSQCPPRVKVGVSHDYLIDTVKAKIVDADDKPLPNQQIQVCGLNVCLYGT